MEQEAAKRVVKIMDELRSLKYDLEKWNEAYKYPKQYDNHIRVNDGCPIEVGKYIPFGTLKAMIVPIIEKRIYDLEREIGGMQHYG